MRSGSDRDAVHEKRWNATYAHCARLALVGQDLFGAPVAFKQLTDFSAIQATLDGASPQYLRIAYVFPVDKVRLEEAICQHVLPGCLSGKP